MASDEIDIIIHRDGEIQMVHDDDAAAIYQDESSRVTTFRASHVEPAPGGGWTADMRPVGGPVLGPYARRDEAVTVEIGVLQMMLIHGKVERR